ncbi:MAG: hypothetical protein BRC34_14850 [Cyanobacteria bacterium QH_1_48_107]|nr:MAG: hypothetical protein BRC34_14850 [Cyanobacteria bacterium QH_1_48_107]
MKILYVGDLSSYARARQRFLAMQELGHLVEGISSVPIEKELAPTTNQPSLWERFRFDLLAFPDASSPRVYPKYVGAIAPLSNSTREKLSD